MHMKALAFHFSLLLSILVFGGMLSGCGDSNANDKAAQLKKYREQAAELQDKIEALETELEGNTRDTAQERSRRLVAVGRAQQKAFTHYIVVPGSADSREDVIVSAETSGRVVQITRKEGQRVRQGQVILKLDGAVLRRNLEEITTQMELARTVYQRRKRLWEQDTIGSEVQYLEAKNQFETLQRRAATLREQLAQTRVKAPIDGYVDEIPVKQGEMLSPGMPVARVVDLSQIRVLADVSERYMGSIRKGDTAEVRFPNLDYRARLPVTFISKVVNTNNRTFQIEIELPGDAEGVKPNMMADVKLADYENPQAVVLSSNVIQRTERGDFVFVIEDSDQGPVARKRKVNTGVTYQGQTEIIKGISPQDQIITQGARIVTDGEPVRIAEEPSDISNKPLS